MEKELGWYDDICRQCGKEQTVSIYTIEQQTWDCNICEYTNPVERVE